MWCGLLSLEESVATRRVRVRNDDTKVLARQYATAKHEEREAQNRRKEIGQQLQPLMEDYAKKIRVDFDSETNATVSLKERDNSQIDAEMLKKKLGAKAYNKLTSPVLDEAKVEAAIQLGEIDANVVASCMNEHKTNYLEVRFTQKRKNAS